MKKSIVAILLMMTMVFSVCGCGSNEAQQKEIPTLSIAYGNDLHCCMLNVAMKDTEAFADKDFRINPLSDTQFELLKNDEAIAKFNVIRGKTGAECATMMAQGHLDMSMCSNTAMQCAYDAGTDIKILSPLHVGAVAMVMAPDVDFYGFDALKKHIDELQRPFKVGYPSAISGPRILTEYVLKEAGFKVTEDPADVSADVLMVDLNGFQNVTTCISNGTVDAWVGTSPFQENAVALGMGKIVLKVDDYPPQGKWNNFPCCVLASKTDAVNQYPEIIEGIVSVVADTIDYANDNWEKFAEINAPIIGFDKEVILASNIVYTHEATQEWMKGIEIYFDTIKSLGKFSNRLKDADYDTMEKEVIDFSFLEKVNAR